MSTFFEDYYKHVAEREAQGIPPLALSKSQAEELVSLLQNIPSGKGEELLDLLTNRINPGVDPAAHVKADFLVGVVKGANTCEVISKADAVKLLGTMVGGYNLQGLIDVVASEDAELAPLAAESLKNMVLAVNCFEDVNVLAEGGNATAKEVVTSWANAEWFTNAEDIPAEIKTVIYKVDGEINTDDFSPAKFAFTRADIPLHSTCMGGSLFPEGPAEIAKLEEKGLPVSFVGDVVGTGSSRKSACNSLLWHIGDDIPFIPNKRRGGVIIGGIIAPIFFNTAEDSGALPIQTDVSALSTGQVITVKPLEGKILAEDGSVITSFEVKPNTILDEFRAGGRVPLIIGKQLTEKARGVLGLSSIEESGLFVNPDNPAPAAGQGYSLAQKMVGKACGVEGILPGTACLPKMTTVGSQDTTGPMTASEMTELACLKFNADLVMQSFCHTAAYPKPTDVNTHATLPDYISNRGGVSLAPGDGVIHSWLNRLLVPDTVGTGGDSHTRFPLGISFPAGSGLVAFAAALGVMPLDMPESVLVRFKGELQPGVTLRDVVNMIPYQAIQEGHLTVAKQGKVNIFSGRVLEIEGLPDLKVEQAFELTDAAAERSAAAATIKLNREPIEEYLNSNITLMEAMIEGGYKDPDTLRKRIADVKDWIANGELMEADANAEYAAVIEIDLNAMTEPIVACPNDPDDVKKISDVAGNKIDEVFIGSCMTNIGHFRAAATVLEGEGQVEPRLWVCPPTKMDAEQLTKEGYYSKFSAAGARIEMPGCSLCMGNQARVQDNAHVFSTSTRNFNNRLGDGAQVYLGSAELAAAVSLLGHIPTPKEYQDIVTPKLEGKDDAIYQYLNFHLLEDGLTV
ncbi:bifunctional aconitate hydratase 2/2-methylisocitrate dehydratase [Lentisphaera marina]|uniref:bifunctional aconitate hydratase 2/2-methylisocitrate dehydratase n=1 Tax=Lentisphaera marina TaxID=1111041 RepID=UPI0023665FAF|nr:bifunctional aconitate hydratase 2/2-methylisocitrate dehydratase [Lentisphaera marina]MDD7986086.1 bifunctional aconitate hydratase 2/2-methylisocitrate dehydratase [Lentisphaera marina]